MVVDVIFLSIGIYFALKFFNTHRGLRYVGFLAIAIALLIVTAYVSLPGLHTFSQILLAVLVVGLPLYFQEEWRSMFGQTETVTTTKYLNSGLIMLLSTLLAVAISILGSGLPNKIGELPQQISVSAQQLPEGTSANFGSQKKISIIVSAPRTAWQNLTAENFSATADIGNRGQGTYEVPVSVVSKIEGVRVVRVKPKRVTVTVEPVIRKTVSLTAKFNGKAGNDLVPDEPGFEPEKVEAIGPKSLVNDLVNAIVQVQLDGQTQPIRQKLNPVALTSSGEVIEDIFFQPAEIEVSVALVKAGKLKTVGVVPQFSGQPASGFWVQAASTEPGVVTVTGQVDALDKITSVPTEPISITGLNKDVTVSALLSFPTGITIADSTQKVSVKLQIAPTTAVKTITPEIVYSNLSAGLKVKNLNPTSINVVVSGPSNTLASLNNSSVKLNLPLAPYKSAGTYSVAFTNANFELFEGLGLVSFLPSAVDVTLESN